MRASSVRTAAVAGSFYPADPGVLAADLRDFLAPAATPERVIAVVVPHAGYVYSGAVAGATYRRVDIRGRVVVLAVNHRGVGAPIAGWLAGWFETPLGRLEVDAELMAAIARRAPGLVHDPLPHAREHSLEVQLPFLQAAAAAPPRIAPILLGTHDLGELDQLGRAVAGAIEEADQPVLIVASTDFTHYEDAASARAKDRLAIEPILAVDGPGLLRTVLGRRISMCGVAPTTAALIAARALGARAATLVRYATSGDVTGDDASVVGYAGLLVGPGDPGREGS